MYRQNYVSKSYVHRNMLCFIFRKLKQFQKSLCLYVVISFSFCLKFVQAVNPNSHSVGGKRKCDLMCNKYIDDFRDTIWIRPLPKRPQNSFKGQCKKLVNPLIVAGRIVQPGEFPHVVALGRQDHNNEFIYVCTGSLISERWVVTTAHCMHQSLVEMIFLGSNRVVKSDGIFISVKKFVLHPNNTVAGLKADIALVEMQRPVTFSKFIKPACLHTDQVSGKVLAAGWGDKHLGIGSGTILKKASLDVVENSRCSKKYNNSDELPGGIEASMLCAGDVNGGWRADTCTGDSGAPLQILHSSGCAFTIVGITSFGKFCAFPGMPGVYTRISYFADWIESIVWHNGEIFNSDTPTI